MEERKKIITPGNCDYFRKVVVPAALGPDTGENAPKNGAYRNVILEYEANGALYIYSSDGIPAKVNNSGFAGVSQVNGKSGDVTLNAADVGALSLSDAQTNYMQKAIYDTNNNGIVDNAEKVNTHTVLTDVPSGAVFTDTTYSAGTGLDLTGTTFSADTDVLATKGDLSSKQNTLTAGSNIDITGDVISASFTAPSPVTVFYANVGETGNSRHIYKESAMTTAVSGQDILDATEDTSVILRFTTSVDPDNYSDAILENVYINTSDYQFVFSDTYSAHNFALTDLSGTTYDYVKGNYQYKLTAGSNITISGNTISATDTTYTAGSGINITSGTISAKFYEVTATFAEQNLTVNHNDTTKHAITQAQYETMASILTTTVPTQWYYNDTSDPDLTGVYKISSWEIQVISSVTAVSDVGFGVGELEGAILSYGDDGWNVSIVHNKDTGNYYFYNGNFVSIQPI